MRFLPYISAIWGSGGPFVGPGGKPHTVVTVQTSPTDVFTAQSTDVGQMAQRGVPIRWFQNDANDQVELEVPNIKSVNIDRSVESDAGTCTIELYNTTMYDNGEAPADSIEIGQHGYYTSTRGDDMSANARWGHQQNPWNGLLSTNAKIRTYQGYGGHAKTFGQALTDGNLCLTGVWLVDEVQITTGGVMALQCRDMMKLLIDQQLFPPLVPTNHYPLKYYRYAFENRMVTSATGVYQPPPPATTGQTPPGVGDLAPGDRTTNYVDSSQDRWYGPNASIHSHRGSDSVDGFNLDTYALSVGNSGPDKVFSTVWWEYIVGEWMNSIYLVPQAGGYTMYVSVMEGGVWQGSQTVPYDYTPLLGRQPTVVDTDADIRYVASFQIPFEAAGEYVLPRSYNAERFRVSFRHLYDSNIGPWEYRAGIRYIVAKITTGAGSIAAAQAPGILVAPVTNAAACVLDHTDYNRYGYISVNTFGQVDVFGDLREKPFSGGDDQPDWQLGRGNVGSVALMPDGGYGYYVAYQAGQVRAYGSATFYGSPYGDFPDTLPGGGENNVASIVVTPSGQGYWVSTWGGEIFAYGDATPYDAHTPSPGEFFHAMAGHTQDDHGLYLLDTGGHVYTRGAAFYRGGWSQSYNITNTQQQDGLSEIAIDIVMTHDDGGYWILTSGGRVQAFGNAVDHGEIEAPGENQSPYDRYYHLLPVPDDEGYFLTDGDGKMMQFGDVYPFWFGAPVPGMVGQLRSDGSYLDYADIIKDLVLWSGFWFKAAVGSGDMPDVFGNIESTGAFSPEPLPDDIFDKRPVIDAITELKETVGYLVYVDDEGGFRWESPNWWGPGNFYYTGEHTDLVPDVDERIQLTDYTVTLADRDMRSKIIVASEDPTGNARSTVYAELIPNTAQGLRGLLKPAMWINGFFIRRIDQRVMAELIALHIWFAGRTGNVTCAANPAIGINDQVRIFERNTAESYLHYVRGVNSTHDLDAGTYTMTLTTHWLGDGDKWAISTNPDDISQLGVFVLSDPVSSRMLTNPSPHVNRGEWMGPVVTPQTDTTTEEPETEEPEAFGSGTFGSGSFGG